MKVLFTFPGLAHYLNALLSKLNEQDGVQVGAIVPKQKSASMGEGVHTAENYSFQVIYADEEKSFYGKPRFKNLIQILENEKPDILVIGWPYALDLVFNRKLIKYIRKNRIRLIYKGIPFNLPARHQIISFFYSENYSGNESAMNQSRTWIDMLKFYCITRLRGIYLRMADAHVFYIDEAIERVASYGVAKEKIFITYNSPDTDTHLKNYKALIQAKPLLKPNFYRIIHVGRLVKWKRVDLLIEAYRLLKKKYPELELIIVGSGPEAEVLKAQAAAESSIIFTGAIYQPEQLGQYLIESSVYVLAGMGGLSINEAMCYAKPVVCSIADGTEKSIVTDDYNGYYFRRGDLNSLAQSIDKLLSDPEKCKLFSQRSLAIIENKVNIREVAKRYIKAFQYVMDNA